MTTKGAMGHWLCLCFLFTLWPTWAMATNKNVEEVSLDFLYVNANAGEAAGGHTALRLGDSIFHYQFFPDGTFLLVREPWIHFQFLYNELLNRTISIASLPMAAESSQQIKNHFTELLIGQQHLFTTMASIQAEIDLLHILQRGKGGIAIPGLGFFSSDEHGQTPSTTTLRATVEATLGRDFLNQALAEVNRNIHTSSQNRQAGQTLLESFSLGEALRVLLAGASLDPKAIIPPMPGEPAINKEQHRQLQRFSDRQLQSILNLLQSTRPDRGTAILLQTARYLVVQHSLKTRQLHSLDPFPDNARTIQLTTKPTLQQSLSHLQRKLSLKSNIRAQLFFQEHGHQEIAYTLLEASRARNWELQQAGLRKHDVRLLPKVKLPSRSRKIQIDNLPTNQDFYEKSTKQLEGKLAHLQQIKDEQYRYNLFFQNCVTKLINSLNTSFADRQAGEEALGAWLEPDSGLVFMPFIFYDRSMTTFGLQEEEILKARRLRNVEQLYSNENDVLVWLRESNALSSTLYEPRVKDTPFLFFTDDSLLLRPVQGIFNLGYATLHGVAGILTLPFDGGERIHQAGRGMFYSLPELAFGNIRKGTYATGE